MPKGLLEVKGSLDVSQFWPSGGSDADTVNLGITGPSFKFSASGQEGNLKETTVFDNAQVKGQKKNVVHGGKLTIRLQGIDAPELHFAALLRHKKTSSKAKPTPLKNNGTKYRQYYGEASTVALGAHLRTNLRGKTCRILTRVDHPNDVFDMYGRLIGDVMVKTAQGEVDVNHWLAENGWAFPTYYNSMNPDEIQKIQGLGTAARQAGRGLWGHETQNTASIDLNLIFRPGARPKPQADVGPVMLPKLFRRRIRYAVSRMNSILGAGVHFVDYLKQQKSDGWVLTTQFLQNPGMNNPPAGQTNFGSLVNQHEIFALAPGEQVFFEGASTLVDSRGRKITGW